jgi:hypothetical protein
MNAEEDLDHLSDQQVSRENQFSPSDDEIAVSLAAAWMLVQLQELAIPPEFAHRMEFSIRARAHLKPERGTWDEKIVGPR